MMSKLDNCNPKAEVGAEIFSIEEISRATGLEESLLRFYESEYADELPDKVWCGDALSFSAEAIEVFKHLHARCRVGQDDDGELKNENQDKYARVIAVTSGKGGVGKSNIALNLAIELQRLGKFCLVLDADMGMANIHLLAGLNPTLDIMALVNGQAGISDIIMEGPGGIGIIPGGGGVISLADSSRRERMTIVNALEEVERSTEVIIVDTGAGMGGTVRDFLVSADDILFVLTPDITSLADAYGLLKAISRHESTKNGAVYSVVNMVRSQAEAADVAQRFADCAFRFLDRKVKNLGYIMKDSTVGTATFQRTPFTLFRPQARVSINTRNVAKALLKEERPDIRLSSSFGKFLKRLDTLGND